MVGVIKPRIVTITAMGPSPPIMVIAAGQDVTWINNDTNSHAVSLSSGTITPGSSFQHTFPQSGDFNYTIDGQHPGTVRVT